MPPSFTVSRSEDPLVFFYNAVPQHLVCRETHHCETPFFKALRYLGVAACVVLLASLTDALGLKRLCCLVLPTVVGAIDIDQGLMVGVSEIRAGAELL